MTSRTRWLVLTFAIIGLGFSIAASYVHYKLLTQPNYVSPCDINAKFNCSEVYLSRYGSFHSVPVALGGVIWFTAVALFAAMAGASDKNNGRERPGGAYVFVLATIGLAAILYFAYTSFFVLKTGCILCIGVYVSVLAIFIVSGTSTTTKVSTLPARLGRDIQHLVGDPLRLLVTLLFVVAAAGLVAYFPKEGYVPPAQTSASTPSSSSPSDNPQERFNEIWAQQPRVDLGIPTDGAKVVIVKFNDWQCPSCKASYYAYKPIIAKYQGTAPGMVKYVTKDYPLNPRCNFSVPQEVHPAACAAAAAVRLAEEKGKHDDMVEWLFANQGTLTQPLVEDQIKKMVGVTDVAKEYARVLPAIQRDAADGAALQIRFTPTFYVNGVKAEAGEGSWLSPEYFDYAIQYELKKAGAK
jgi:vitamin-K-epoxide reductase (warfarin-sensitive)